MSKITNPSAIKRQLEKIAADALAVVVDELGEVLQEKIQSVEWAWPNETKRRNGSTVTSPRDIVDLGNLLRSQALVRESPSQYRFEWDPLDPETGFPYALIVHEGLTSRRARYKARPWTEAALAAFDVEKSFAREVSSRV
jgi:hypothetical protein